MATCSCTKCGSSWEARVKHPIMCPICKRKDWDGKHNSLGAVVKVAVSNECKCLKCGNEWVSRVVSPVACPACLSRQWNVPRLDGAARKCLKCGNEWISRGAGVPVACPACQSRAWNGSFKRAARPDSARECLKCGHKWETRAIGENPIRCPACKRMDWMKKPGREETCYRCGYVWHGEYSGKGRPASPPERCPSCHWIGWNVERNPACGWCGGVGCDRCQSEQPAAGCGVVVSVMPPVIRRDAEGVLLPCFWCGGKGCEWCGGGADSE